MRWYDYGIDEVWIIERLYDDVYMSDFELRIYNCDGSVEREILEYHDAVATINMNCMKKFSNNKVNLLYECN